MSYEYALAHLDALGIDAMKGLAPTLGRIEAICDFLDNPQRSVPAIHVTGTNGKTSTARIASAVLGAAGLTVATYTSPHLQTVRERLSLGGEPISEEEFGDVFDHIRPYIAAAEERTGEGLSYFEILTAMFFLWAAERPVDVSVIEVGLGGRWDATNVVDAPVAVITNVGLDHTGLLGLERETIAREKAGIIKPGSVCVTGERSPGVLEVVAAEAAGAGASVAALERDFRVVHDAVAVGGRVVTVATSSVVYDSVFLSLHGRHQAVNAACALEACDRFLARASLGRDLVAAALGSVAAPGRLEIVRPQGRAPVVLDVAHNPDGMSALVASLVETIAFERVVVVLGVLADKDFDGMIAELARLEAVVVAAEPRSARSVPADRLEGAAAAHGLQCSSAPDVTAAIEAALQLAGAGDIVCVTGSHYVVGEARTHLLGAPA